MRERHRRDWGIREREDEGETQEGLGYQVCVREREDEGETQEGLGYQGVCVRERG